jgi:hypothetical protein
MMLFMFYLAPISDPCGRYNVVINYGVHSKRGSRLSGLIILISKSIIHANYLHTRHNVHLLRSPGNES